MKCETCKRDVEMLKFTTTGVKCCDCHAAERGQMWKCPTCNHVMNSTQSKWYRGCPTGIHGVKHVLVFARAILSPDGTVFSHYEDTKVCPVLLEGNYR